nr:MAG TPA: hypothetical protein [Bacteriophage sp.]
MFFTNSLTYKNYSKLLIVFCQQLYTQKFKYFLSCL